MNSAKHQVFNEDIDIYTPLILLGRGGSGTRLLSQIVLQRGIFLGNDINISGDSVEWVPEMYQLGFESCTTEIKPGSDRDNFWIDALRRKANQIIEKAQLPLGSIWGWKLPETILSLPQVLAAFPRARVIHLTRHPFTSSLRRSHLTSRPDNIIGSAVLYAAYEAAFRPITNLERDPTFIHNALTWNYQVGKACAQLAKCCPASHIKELRYEDLCRDIEHVHSELDDFLGSPVGLDSDTFSVDWNRVDRVDPQDERLEEVWSICGATAALLGYSRDNFSAI